MGCFCSKSTDDSPGDLAFDEGDKTYREFKRIDASQKNTPEAQALLSRATKSYNFAVDYYRKHKDANLGAVLVNLATLKWDIYRSTVQRTEEKRSAERLEEVIRLDEEALTLWQSRDPKPEPYPALLGNLAAAYLERFVKNKQCSDIQQALRLYKDVCDSTEETTRNYIEATMQIGITYWTWYCDPSNITTRNVDQMDNAIRYLMNAHELCRSGFPDIRYSCLYILAWIHHHQFEKQEEIMPPNPEDYLGQAIHFYQCTLQIMPPNDIRYAKALWFVSMLLFHRYERDRRERDLQEAQRWAKDALNFPAICDPDQRKQLQAVRDFDENATPETTRNMRVAVRRSTLVTYRSESAEYSMQSPVMSSISEVDESEHEKNGGKFGISGVGIITNEPQSME